MVRYEIAEIENVADLCLLLNQLFSKEEEFEPDTKKQTIALRKML